MEAIWDMLRRRTAAFGARRAFALLLALVWTLPLLACAGLSPLPAPEPTPTPYVPTPPDELLVQYHDALKEGAYDAMYDLLAPESQSEISRADFVARNQKIYQGIGAENLGLRVLEVTRPEDGRADVRFEVEMDTLAGAISFYNVAPFRRDERGEYGLLWTHAMIIPELAPTDKVRVSTLRAARGEICDRNGELLAGKGVASSIGVVPGKLRAEPDRAADLASLATQLGLTPEGVAKALSASYVTDETFVPLKTVAKDQQTLKDALLLIPGVKIIDTDVRAYPLGKAAGHLTGYVQGISAEELEQLKGEGYTANSIIGKSGAEKIYEETLRGRDGVEIAVYNEVGEKKQVLAATEKRDGQDVTLTVDAKTQSALYEQLSADKSAGVASNPLTGEVLALVSSPTFDPNDFSLGMTSAQWQALNDDPAMPLVNRFRATFCPGSSIKPIIAAIGLSGGAFDPEKDFGASGKAWQKDSSWGNYTVTTLTTYNAPANLRNALIYSDNIYFAKLALEIGAQRLADGFASLGFTERAPFDFSLASSVFANGGALTGDIQIADTGYGQGELLVNPVHMASMYSAFANGGSVIAPQLELTEISHPVEWKSQVIPAEAAATIRDDLIQVVERGTGKEARIPGRTFAGKTGTAEIKRSKTDTTGTEIGWYCSFEVLDEGSERQPLLIVALVEDVKDRGGSHYVIPKVKRVFEMTSIQNLRIPNG